MHRIFVYGTLKRGFPNHVGAMTDLFCLGRFRTVEAFPLVVGGEWFSPYLIDEPGEGHRVFGEVFEANDEAFDALDRIEGTHLPGGYRRISIVIEDVDGGAPFQAWTYVKDRKTIRGIRTNPMEEYAQDPRYVIPSKRTSCFQARTQTGRGLPARGRV